MLERELEAAAAATQNQSMEEQTVLRVDCLEHLSMTQHLSVLNLIQPFAIAPPVGSFKYQRVLINCFMQLGFSSNGTFFGGLTNSIVA